MSDKVLSVFQSARTYISASILAVVTVAFMLTSVASAATSTTYRNNTNNTTVTVQIGSNLHINLSNRSVIPEGQPGSTLTPTSSARTSSSPWFNFASSSTNAVALVSNTTYTSSPPAGNGTKVTHSVQNFKAAAVGSSTITAMSSTNSVCGSDVQCPIHIITNRYKLTVNVVAASANQ